MLFNSDRGVKQATPYVRGEKREIACKMWFSTKGELTPIMFKMADEDGVIQQFDKISVNFSEVKEYAGTISHEFDCNIIVHGFQVNVILEFFPETLKWFLIEKHKKSQNV